VDADTDTDTDTLSDPYGVAVVPTCRTPAPTSTPEPPRRFQWWCHIRYTPLAYFDGYMDDYFSKGQTKKTAVYLLRLLAAVTGVRRYGAPQLVPPGNVA
jgi:hypothetical protein